MMIDEMDCTTAALGQGAVVEVRPDSTDDLLDVQRGNSCGVDSAVFCHGLSLQSCLHVALITSNAELCAEGRGAIVWAIIVRAVEGPRRGISAALTGRRTAPRRMIKPCAMHHFVYKRLRDLLITLWK